MLRLFNKICRDNRGPDIALEGSEALSGGFDKAKAELGPRDSGLDPDIRTKSAESAIDILPTTHVSYIDAPLFGKAESDLDN